MSDKPIVSRRELIAGLSVGSLPLIAGCNGGISGSGGSGLGETSECTIEQSTGSVESTSVIVDGRLSSADVEFDFRWNARSQDGIVTPDPGDSGAYSSDSGEKYLVVKFVITNTTDNEVLVSRKNFEATVDTPNIRDTKDPKPVVGDISVDTIFKPSGNIQTWLFFEIPENSTKVTISPSNRRYWESDRSLIALAPECDRSINISLDEFKN